MPSEELLTEEALRIDKNPLDRSPHVRIDAVVSRTAAVWARSALERAIETVEASPLLGGDDPDLAPERALPHTWMYRVVVRALEDAINSDPVPGFVRTEAS